MIYVNGRFLLQNLTGVNRFAYELCRAWTQMGVTYTLCCPPGHIKECYDVSHFDIHVCGKGKSHIWEQLFLPLWFNRIKGEKILISFTGLGPLLTRRKVMTIHDLAFMANPSWYSFSYKLWYRMMSPLCAATSIRILTVSQFSKSEIIRRLSIKEKKISVIYNAVSPYFHESSGNDGQDEQIKAKRYILAVSSIDPRKNFAMLLKAFALVKDKSIMLYIVGGQDAIYSTSITELSNGIHSKRIKWLGRTSDAKLKSLYEHALCFVYPSLYEGFGIPPLEAMCCGTPTVVSAIPALKEVCGEASLYVNPEDERDIAEKIDMAIGNEDLRQSLIRKGYERCVLFDWQRSAEALYGIINELPPCGK